MPFFSFLDQKKSGFIKEYRHEEPIFSQNDVLAMTDWPLEEQVGTRFLEQFAAAWVTKVKKICSINQVHLKHIKIGKR